MKNLKNKNVAYLPKKASMRFRERYWRGHEYGVYHPVDGVWPYERTSRLIEANIGERFADVFSKYCSEVPVYQQRFFLDNFEDNRRYRWMTSYYVDNDGLIQKTGPEKESKVVTYYSDDYRVERLHKVTKKSYPERWDFKRLKDIKDEDYDYFTVEGFKREFSSKNDPTYKRLMAEKANRRKALYRQYNKEKEEKLNELVNKAYERLKEEKQKEIEANKVKIESKGFDWVQSFRNDKQTNPDEIKITQGFLKKVPKSFFIRNFWLY